MRNSILLLASVIALFAGGCDKADNTPGSGLELVFSDSTYQLTGVAVSHDGRIFTNYPLWSDIYLYAVAEIKPVNQAVPYPDADMNSWKPGDNGQNKWVCVQAVYIDDANNLWVVDPAAPRMGPVYQNSHKVVKINPATNTIQRTYPFAGITGAGSYINDIRVDTASQVAYLTNSNEGGIVVLDLNTGNARQLLTNHYSMKSDPSYTFIIDGKELRKNGQPAKINSDGIALSPGRDWLYYKPLTDNKLYRIRTEYLRDRALTDAEVESKVEDLGRFCSSDGMIFDKKGNLYLGDVQNYRIVRISPDLKMTTIIQDDRLIWPDSYSISDDGFLYISCSQINKQPDYNEGVNRRTSPYAIYRIKLPS